MQIWTVLRIVLQQLQVPWPHGVVISFCLACYEAAFDRRLGELLECHAASGRHHQGDPVVGQPAVDRLHQIQTSVIEEEAVGAQDHVVETRRQSSIFVVVGYPGLYREITIESPDFNLAAKIRDQCIRESRIWNIAPIVIVYKFEKWQIRFVRLRKFGNSWKWENLKVCTDMR